MQHQGDDDSVDMSVGADAPAHPVHHYHRRHDHTEPDSAEERQTHGPNVSTLFADIFPVTHFDHTD